MAESYLTEDERQLLESIEDYIENYDQLPTLSDVSNFGPFNSPRNIILLEDLVEHKILEEELIVRNDNEMNVYRPAE